MKITIDKKNMFVHNGGHRPSKYDGTYVLVLERDGRFTLGLPELWTWEWADVSNPGERITHYLPVEFEVEQ